MRNIKGLVTKTVCAGYHFLLLFLMWLAYEKNLNDMPSTNLHYHPVNMKLQGKKRSKLQMEKS